MNVWSWGLHQPDGVAVAVAPLMHKRIGRAQLVARREKEEGSAGAVRDAELAQRLHHRLRAMLVGRYGEHAKVTGPPGSRSRRAFRQRGRSWLRGGPSLLRQL